MTTGVLVVNASAVALAADQRETVLTPAGHKYHDNVRKIFALSDDPPVALMAYGSLSLAQTRWEVLAHQFYGLDRKLVGSLAEIGQTFLEWLNVDSVLAPDVALDGWRRGLKLIAREYVSPHDLDMLRSAGDSAKPRRKSQLIGRLRGHLELLEASQFLREGGRELDEDDVDRQLDENAEEYSDVTAALSGLGHYADEARVLLHRILAESSCRSFLQVNATGLVVAGYGCDDTTPTFLEIPCVTMEKTKVRASQPKVVRVPPDSPVEVRSYALGDEIQTFLDGIHPNFRRQLSKYLKDIDGFYRKLFVWIGSCDPYLDDEIRGDLRQLLNTAPALSDSILDSIVNEFRLPTLKGVEKLPEDAVAEVASILVRKSGLKYKVHVSESEAVSSVVTTVLMTRQRGLVWIPAQRGR